MNRTHRQQLTSAGFLSPLILVCLIWTFNPPLPPSLPPWSTTLSLVVAREEGGGGGLLKPYLLTVLDILCCESVPRFFQNHFLKVF